MSIGQRLREERERSGLSQPKLAALASTTKQTVHSWESGKTAPDGFQLAAMSGAGVDVGYVVTGERDYTPPPAMSAEELTMLNYFREASPEVRRAALGALLGASAVQRGPNVVQQSSGSNAKHYGDIAGDININKRKRG